MSSSRGWETTDGRRFELYELTDPHLRNIIRHVHLLSYPDYVRYDILVQAGLRGWTQKYIKKILDTPPEPWLDIDGHRKVFSREKMEYVNVE